MEERAVPNEFDDRGASNPVLGRRGPSVSKRSATVSLPSPSPCSSSRSALRRRRIFPEPDLLIRALADLWPSYLGYVVGVVTIGIMWANHHDLFRLIGTVSHGLILANLLLLLGVGSCRPMRCWPPRSGHQAIRSASSCTPRRSSGWRWRSTSCGGRSAAAPASCIRTSTGDPSTRSPGATGSGRPASRLPSSEPCRPALGMF